MSQISYRILVLQHKTVLRSQQELNNLYDRYTHNKSDSYRYAQTEQPSYANTPLKTKKAPAKGRQPTRCQLLNFFFFVTGRETTYIR